ncbi:MAG: serine hydrolase [Acidobacteriota bacterium]
MTNILTRSFLSFLLLFSMISAALPTAGYAQTATQTAAAVDLQKGLTAIEEKTEARRKELGIPGMSLVIVKDGEIVYAKGLGYKDFEKKIAVTEDTQFAIGSATKAFTALTVLMAQDEGKLSLDDSPKKALPYFKMFDPETDKNITIRDLLSHASGLNRTDLAMITGKLSRAELIQVAGQAKPTAKLREKFQYQNLMFTAAGEIAATVEKKPWEKLVAERIFKPLGMKNSNLSIRELEKSKDHSFGYNYNFDTKETTRLPYRGIEQVSPAGAINSSARDMAEWLKFVLNGGTVGGKRLVSENGFSEWLKPQMKISPNGKSAYGLGWFIQEWNGLKVIQHGGNIDGFNSMVAMIPEKKLGFVMLTNVSSSPLGNELMPLVWSNMLGENKPSDAAKQPLDAMRLMAGKYHLEQANIDIEVAVEGDDLVMTVPGQPKYKLERTAPRQFKLVGAPDGFSAKFTPEQGDATELQLQQPQGNVTLKRVGATPAVPTAATAGPNPAKELVGEYAAPGGNGSVELKEDADKVTFNIRGQQPYTLNEKSKDNYSMSPLPDTYSIKAKRDADGKVASVVVTQPEGEFEFKRKAAKAGDMPLISVDELMQRSIDVIGGEANWRKITTRVSEYDVDLENQGVKATAVAYAKAPNLTATETKMTALGKLIATGWEYFDGSVGEDIYSFAPADRYSGKRLEDVRLGSDFYAPLDWKLNFKKIEVKGTGKVGDEDAYIVRFEPEKATGFTEYYSTKTFLLLKREGVVPSSTSSQQLPYTITFSDYRDVDGLKLPFKMVNYSISNGNIVTVVKSVKHNVPVENSIFKMRVLKQ